MDVDTTTPKNKTPCFIVFCPVFFTGLWFPRTLFKTRDLELPFFEGSLPSCWPHSAGYTRTSVHPYFLRPTFFAIRHLAKKLGDLQNGSAERGFPDLFWKQIGRNQSKSEQIGTNPENKEHKSEEIGVTPFCRPQTGGLEENGKCQDHGWHRAPDSPPHLENWDESPGWSPSSCSCKTRWASHSGCVWSPCHEAKSESPKCGSGHNWDLGAQGGSAKALARNNAPGGSTARATCAWWRHALLSSEML